MFWYEPRRVEHWCWREDPPDHAHKMKIPDKRYYALDCAMTLKIKSLPLEQMRQRNRRECSYRSSLPLLLHISISSVICLCFSFCNIFTSRSAVIGNCNHINQRRLRKQSKPRVFTGRTHRKMNIDNGTNRRKRKLRELMCKLSYRKSFARLNVFGMTVITIRLYFLSLVIID